MGSRSRKRSRVAADPAPSEPLDEFSAIAPPPAEAAETEEAEGPEAPSRKRLRGEAANQAIRAGLAPLGDGERPPALVVAVVLTFLLGLGNLAAYLLGAQVDGQAPPVTGIIGFASLMLVMAWGMWTLRYWAILGFQALLALVVVIFALIMPTASNLEAVVVCAAVIGLGGWLFWKLVRVMSRVQVPPPPGHRGR